MNIINEETDLDKFWLVTDGLNLSSNLNFGLGKSYFCGHGCHVCFIRDELKSLKSSTKYIYNNDLEIMKPIWEDLYTFFASYSLDEDPYYFKLNHIPEYKWYLKNAHNYSYGTTDNGIFRINKLKDIKFKSMEEIALSITFIENVGEEKIIKTLNDLMPIKKIKFLIDKLGKYPQNIVDWVRSKNIPIIVHKMNFSSGVETEFDVMGFDQVQQVNWVAGRQEEELVKVHINSDTLLYYDSFYFSNNTGDTSYFTLDPSIGKFDYRSFLASMLESKQRDYKKYAGLIEDSPLKKYFFATQKYKVNYNFNFIPNFMVDYKVKFFLRMIELGWIPTKYGLIETETDNVISIIEKN